MTSIRTTLTAMALRAVMVFGVLACGPVALADATPAWVSKGTALVEKGQYAKAVRVLERGMAADSSTVPPAAHLAFALALNQIDEAERAAVAARQASDRATDPFVAASAQAALMLALVKTGEVDAEFDQASEVVRAYLRKGSGDEDHDRLRVRFCQVRSFVAPPHSLSLAVELDRERVHDPDAAGVDQDFAVPRGILVPAPRVESRARSAISRKEQATLSTIIDTDGCVAAIEIVDATSPGWGDVVSATAARWVFEPARLGGKPVATWYRLTSNYVSSVAGSAGVSTGPSWGRGWGSWSAHDSGDLPADN